LIIPQFLVDFIWRCLGLSPCSHGEFPSYPWSKQT